MALRPLRPIVQMIRFEARLWAALARLVAGYAYHRPVTPLWLTLAVLSLIELPAVEPALPSRPVRWALLVLGVWSLVLGWAQVAGARAQPRRTWPSR